MIATSDPEALFQQFLRADEALGLKLDTALTLAPEAVIEIISRGSEDKDLTLNPPFYLAQGVKDVLVVDPYTTEAWHFRRDGKTRGALPYKATLECGCRCVLG